MESVIRNNANIPDDYRPHSRKALKRLEERFRYEQREMAKAMQERARRSTCTRNDDAPLPRID